MVHGLPEPVFTELCAEQGEGQPGADQGDVAAFAQEVRRGPDVVLVPVGQHERLDLVESIPDRFEVGQDQVDARVVVLREQHATVDDQESPVVLEDGHVAADLAETPKWDDPQTSLRQGAGQGEFRVRVTHGFLSDQSGGLEAAAQGCHLVFVKRDERGADVAVVEHAG